MRTHIHTSGLLSDHLSGTIAATFRLWKKAGLFICHLSLFILPWKAKEGSSSLELADNELCLHGAASWNLLLSKDPKVSSGLLDNIRMDANEGRIEGLNSVNVFSTFLTAACGKYVRPIHQPRLCHQFNTWTVPAGSAANSPSSRRRWWEGRFVVVLWLLFVIKRSSKSTWRSQL